MYEFWIETIIIIHCEIIDIYFELVIVKRERLSLKKEDEALENVILENNTWIYHSFLVTSSLSQSQSSLVVTDFFPSQETEWLD